MTFEQLMGIGPEFPNKPVEQLYENNRSAYQEIKALIRKNNLLPFIGAGFSASIYPTWLQFLKDTAESFPDCLEALHEHLEKGEYEEAADVLCEEMTDFTFRQKLSAIFSRQYLEENKDKLSPARKLLCQLFHGNILTTNYDKILESIFDSTITTLCPHTDYTKSRMEELQQNNHPAIIKLHGDIDDVSNAVITSNDYNTRYGISPSTTSLVQALTQILTARPVLFLGCSLSSDRTLQVLSSCIGSKRTYFALVELPKETRNDEQPFLPNIVTIEGKQNTTYRERRRFLARHHINCIWYPHGMHDALDILLKQLCSEIFSEPISVPLSPMFQNEREIIGREETIDELVESLRQGDTIAFVYGPGGIGKTEICRCAAKKFLMTKPENVAFYIELYGVDSIPTFCAAVAKALHVDSLLETTETDACFAWLSDTIERQYPSATMLLYLDNFEDLWFALSKQETERIKLLQWLEQRIFSHTCVLISGRGVPRNYNFRIKFHEVTPLDSSKQDDHKLFNRIYAEKGGKAAPEGPEYTELLQKLDGHPLTIVLVATYAARVPHWKFVLDVWSTVEMHGTNERHTSLHTALSMSWNYICDDILCVDLWGIMALSIDEVAIDTLSTLFPEESSHWKDALPVLYDASLVTWSEDAVKMLSPVKEFFFQQAEKTILERAIARYSAMIYPHIESTQIGHENRTTAHARVIEMMPQILHTFTRAIDADVMKDTTKHLCYALNNYYRHCTIYSVKFLKKLQGHATDKRDNRLTAFASKYCGDLQSRLGQIDDAMQLYQSAQNLYLSEQEIVGLSYTTSDLCYLHSLKGEDKKTEQCVQMLHELIHKIPYTEVKEYVLAKIKAALDNRS